MLEQGKWKDGAPVPSKEFHDRFEESLKLIEKRIMQNHWIRKQHKTGKAAGRTAAMREIPVREPSVKRLAALQLPCLRVIAAARPCTFPLS